MAEMKMNGTLFLKTASKFLACVLLFAAVSPCAGANVAELITRTGPEFSDATTNGFPTVQSAVDAATECTTNRACFVRLLADRRETVRISRNICVCIHLDGHILRPDSTAVDGEVLVVQSAGGSGRVEISNGRLAGNVLVNGGTDLESACHILFFGVTLGDNDMSENGQITAAGSCSFEFDSEFIGNCSSPYAVPDGSAYIQAGACFACDQSAANGNDTVRMTPNVETGIFEAETKESDVAPSGWNSPENWMSGMQRQTPLSRLAMISAHDAGMVDGHAGGELITIGDSLTQKKTVENQMKEAGARFFDLRPRRVGFWPLQTWYTCHGAVLGQRFSTIFKAGKSFVENHKSEVVFMRISHYKYDELKELIDMLRKDYDSVFFKRNDNPILNEVPLGEARGKIILLIDKEMLDGGKYGVSLDPSAGIWGLDAQEGHGCVPGRAGGYLYIHDDYANQDDFDKMKSFVFDQWKKQSEHVQNDMLSPESRAFMLCWQLTPQPPIVGKGIKHWTNHYRAYVCSQHLEEDMRDGVETKRYVRPMLVNLDYVDEDDFAIVNAYNECNRTSEGRVCIPQEMWDDLRKHPAVTVSISYVADDGIHRVEMAKGYRDSSYRCFDLPFGSLNRPVTVLFSVLEGAKDANGEPVASRRFEFVDGGTNVVCDVGYFPTMTAEYIDHDADGTVHPRTISDSDLIPVTSATEKETDIIWSDTQSGKMYVVADTEVTIPCPIHVWGNIRLLIPDGRKLTANSGIIVMEGDSLTVFGQREDTGVLTARGRNGTAGIGGVDGEPYLYDGITYKFPGCGDVTIHGTAVTAVGGNDGAGIGSGLGIAEEGGTITIHGGTVDATGGTNGAGIGGAGWNWANVVITGGKVTARGGENAAGIGAGSNAWSSFRVKIDGGTVTATGGRNGAGIGLGRYNGALETVEVAVNGGTVTAQGGENRAGIGGNVEWNREGTPYVNSPFYPGETDPTVAGGSMGMAIHGGMVTATGGRNGPGFGGSVSNDVVAIHGGTVTAVAGESDADCAGFYGKVEFGGAFVGAVLAGANAENADYVSKAAFSEDHGAKFATMPVAAVRIPQVDGLFFVVSNAAGTVSGVLTNGMYTYAVEPGERVDVHFGLLPGYAYAVEPAANPMELGTITGLTVVDAEDLPVAGIPYLDWDEANGTLTNAVRATPEFRFVTEETTEFSDGWYVVMGNVRRKASKASDDAVAPIAVVGDAHLILCDGGTLEVDPSFGVNPPARPGIEVAVSGPVTNSLTIYGQPNGTGKLSVKGGEYCAAIGSGPSNGCGRVTINGGTLDARGWNGAGIGGGMDGHGGHVTINGGNIYTWGWTGIGGCRYGNGCRVTVNGGNVEAAGNFMAIGGGIIGTDPQTRRIVPGILRFGDGFEGGVRAGQDSSKASLVSREYFLEHRTDMQYNTSVFTYVTWPVETVEVRVPRIEGVDLVVSNGAKTFEPESDGDANVYVVGGGENLRLFFTLLSGFEYVKEPAENPMRLGPVMEPVSLDSADLPSTVRRQIEYLDWDETGHAFTNAVLQASEFEFVTPETDVLSNGWHVVNRNVVKDSGIVVEGDARLLLCDGASLVVTGENDQAGIGVSEGNSLAVYGQSEGSGRLVATGAENCAGIGGVGREACGAVAILGGVVTSNGGPGGSGIGGGSRATGGEVTILGGSVTATGGSSAKGIGGGYIGDDGTVSLNEWNAWLILAGADASSAIGVQAAAFTTDHGTTYVHLEPWTEIPRIVSAAFSADDDATVFSVSLESVQGYAYRLKRGTDLAVPVSMWTVVASAQGNGGTLTLVDPEPPEDRAFYVVEIQL